MDPKRRTLLRYLVFSGGVSLAGCSSSEDDDGPPDGLGRVELANYDTATHTVDLVLSTVTESGDSASRDVVVERTVTLPPATIRSDGERDPAEEWVSDFPDRPGNHLFQWSMNGGEQEVFRTGDIQGCKLIRVEISGEGQVAVSAQDTNDCYGRQ